MEMLSKLRPYLQFSKFFSIVKTNKNFVFVWIAQIFTQVAVSFIPGAIAYLSNEGVLSDATKESAASIGIISILSTVPALVAGPIAGVLADWFSKKKIMIFSNVLRFVILTAFILFTGWENQILSYLLILILTAVLQFFIPAEGGLIPQLVEKKFILFANSIFSLTVYASLAIGFLFAGPIINTTGISLLFIICACSFLLSTFFIYRVNVDEQEAKTVGPSREKTLGYLIEFMKYLVIDAYHGVSYSFRNKKLRFALLHLFTLQIGGLTLFTVVYRIGSEIYGVSAETAGLVVFAPIAIGLLSGLFGLNVFGRNRRRVGLIWFGTIISFIGFGCMGVISQIGENGFYHRWYLDKIISTGSLLAVGVSIPFMLIPAQTLIYENSKDEFRGRVLGVWLALTTSLASLVATFIGYLSDRWESISVAILILALIQAVYSFILLWLYKTKRLQSNQDIKNTN